MTRLLRESFIPILLVIGSIFLIIVYSQYVADSDAEQVTIIEIPSDVTVPGDDEIIADESSDEESFSHVEKLRIDDPVYIDAYLLIKNKQWQQAEKLYNDLITISDTSQSRTDLGYIYYKLGNYKMATEQFSVAINKQPIYSGVYYYRAKAWSKLHNYDLAAKDYLIYVSLFPSDFPANFNLGVIRFKQKNYNDAIKYFTVSSELAPGRKKSKALYYLGKSFQKLGPDYHVQAGDAYRQSIRVFPGTIKPRMGLASLLPDSEAGRLEAEDIYQQIILLKPNYASAYFSLAGIYKSQGKVRNAVDVYRKAIEFNPSHIPARFNLGLILLDKKKWNQAADQFRAIININPQHAKSHFNLGRANYRLKLYDQALVNYQTALDIRGGDYPEVATNIGLIYSAKKEYKKAIEIYQSALKYNKDSAKLYYNIGMAYFKSEENTQALEALNSAIQRRPDYPQAWYNMALIYGLQDEQANAITAYRKALLINPEYRSAQLGLAMSLAQTGELKEAEAVYRKVLAVHPRYASAWINLGLVLIDQELFDEAEDVLMQASQLEVDNDRISGLLAKVLVEQEKYTEASEYYRLALDRNPDSKQYRLEYIRVLRVLHEYEKALSEVKKAMKLYPDSKLVNTEFEQISLELKKNH